MQHRLAILDDYQNVAHGFADWSALEAQGIAVTTFVIYPLFYTPLIHAHPVMAAVLTTRNVLLVVLLWWSVKRTAELGRKNTAAVPSNA